MTTIQKLIKLLFLLCFISTWYSCENNEIYPEKVSIPAEITNRSAILLLEQLQDNDNIYQEFQSTLSGNQPHYDLVQIITHSDFGLCYYIPYSQTANSKITGAIYLPAGATLAEDGQAELDGTLGTPMNMNAHTINHEVNITQRFLYSVPFKKLQEQGVEVEPELTIYANLLNNKIIPLNPEEYSFPNTLQSRASVDMIRISISYSSDYIGSQTDAIIGLSPETLKQIIYKSLIQMGINNIRPDNIKHDFQMIHVQFPVSYINIPDFLNRLMQVIRYNALAKGFDLILQYQYDIKQEFSSGGSSSGSGTGGSSSSSGSESSTSSPTSPEEDSSTQAKSIQRKVHQLWKQLDTIQAAVLGTNTYITFQDYLTEVNNDPQNEHSTTLIDYGTEQYLTEVIHGTENGVSNNVSSEYVIAEIHNHPNGPPLLHKIYYSPPK